MRIINRFANVPFSEVSIAITLAFVDVQFINKIGLGTSSKLTSTVHKSF